MPLKRVHGVLRNLNWRPSRPNQFAKLWDRKKKVAPVPIAPLDENNIGIWDQGQLGSCTAHGTGFIWAYRYFRENGSILMPSRLFIYYCERMMEGDIDQDNGAIVADGVAALLKYGVPPESEWPYDISKFAVKPDPLCWIDGVKLAGIEDNAVSMDVNSIRSSLQADNPITFGFTVFESFMEGNWLSSGLMPLPERGENIEGGHCVAFVGDEPTKSAFWVRNSWGPDWSRGGRFLMPYAFLSNCSDGWNMPKVAQVQSENTQAA